jgi:hypothetical protein
MKEELFREQFRAAAQMLREQIASGKLSRTDVAAMQCVITVGLPSTPRQDLPVWVLLVATLPPESIDYDEIMHMSYQLTFPRWKRNWWKVADAYRSLQEHEDSDVLMRSRD